MTELIPSSDWGTLGKILGGQFLECFYVDYEFFRCSLGNSIVRSDPGVLGARIMSVPFVRKVARKLRGKQGPPPEFRATSTEDFATLYKEVSDPWDISTRVAHYREAWEWIFQQLPAPEPSVTDVGCGVGTFLKALMTVRPDVHAEGIEFSPVAAKTAWRATNVTIHTGDIAEEDCFRACPPAALLTFIDILLYLPDNGKQGMINCLRFLQPRYVLIGITGAEKDDAFIIYERSYSWNSAEVSLAKVASCSFKFPPTPRWAGGTQRFVLYRVVYKNLTDYVSENKSPQRN
jgi:SAM-dependent methyltransferase